MFIKLKHDARCADCGALLPAGERARFYRDGTIYGEACHRWQVEVGRAEIEALQAAVKHLKIASRDRAIPDPAAALLARLKRVHGQRITQSNFKRLLRDLNRAARMIERNP